MSFTHQTTNTCNHLFSNAGNSHEIAAILIAQRDLLAGMAPDVDGHQGMLAYSELTDAAVRRVFELAVEDVRKSFPEFSTLRGVAVAAVGGYGRQEMCPYSDVDVAFISESENDEEIDLLVKKAFRLLMDMVDAAGLKVGYSFRSINDVENLDLETQTALLDARILAGDRYLMSVFMTGLRKAIVPCAFVTGHLRSRKVFDESKSTPYVIYPNVKEGIGALRDLQTICWIAQITYDLFDVDVWSGLRAKGIVLDEDISAVMAASEFHSRLRRTIHLLGERGSDSIGPGMAQKASAYMGFSSIDNMMFAYYRYASIVRELLLRIAEACLEESLLIEPGVVSVGGFLRVVDSGLLIRDNASVIRIFKHCQDYSLRIHRQTRILIKKLAASWTMDRKAAKVFMDILSSPGFSICVRDMADCGILQVIMPNFCKLMLLIPGDSAHKYTIGEHSLRVLEELEILMQDESGHFVDILSRLQNLEVLTLAALLHDIGKIDSRKDHAKTGAPRAGRFAKQLGMDDDYAKRVEALVRHHLRMNETARLRDLNQPRTVKNFASVIKDIEMLDMLLLLSIADLKGVGLRQWNQVQMRFLLELHERSSSVIRSPDRPVADIGKHRNRVRRELKLANLPEAEVDEHCESTPVNYLLNASPEELALHIGYVISVKSNGPAVDIREDRGAEYTQITVFVKDRPGLLYDIAGTLAALGLSIHAAQVYTRESADHIVIDRLYVDFEGRQLSQMKKWQVEGELIDVLKGDQTVDQVWNRLGKKRCTELTGVSVTWNDDLSDQHTVLEIRADDAPGLLHFLTGCILRQGWNIHSARVSTWGHEARDVFYITDRENRPVDHAELEAFAQSIS